MKYTYEIITDQLGNTMLLRSDEAWIPMDESNADYQAYLNKDTLPSNSSIPQAGE
jgi:hypothetical protein